PPKGKDGKAFAGGGHNQNVFGSLTHKLVTAAGAKAKGVLIVNDAELAAKSDDLVAFEYTSRENPPVDIPSVHITRAMADTLLKSAGKSLKELEEQINRSVETCSLVLGEQSANLNVAIERPQVEINNVIGVLPGKGSLANEYVIIGAHYDHLGHGE